MNDPAGTLFLAMTIWLVTGKTKTVGDRWNTLASVLVILLWWRLLQ